nr:hypothetical protein [Tanacetum cinerariifolium]
LLKTYDGGSFTAHEFREKVHRAVRFGNDHFGAIMGYRDYVTGDSVISRHSCYVRDTDGVELIKGSHGSNLYTISVEDMMKSSPICLLYKASEETYGIRVAEVLKYDVFILDSRQCNLHSSGIVFLQQWELSPLAVGTSSGSRNSITGSGNALCILFPTILP